MFAYILFILVLKMLYAFSMHFTQRLATVLQNFVFLIVTKCIFNDLFSLFFISVLSKRLNS